jgi:hypothetical protein
MSGLRTTFGCGKTLLAAALAVLLVAAPAGAATLPFAISGSDGPLNLSPLEDAVFNTDTGTYTIGGNTQSYPGTAITMSYGGANLQTMVWDFNSINVGTGCVVTAIGSRPLTLLSAGNVNIAGQIDVSGTPGGTGQIGAVDSGGGGGGGGGAGGALAIFTNGSQFQITTTGSILANGALGGVGGAPGTTLAYGTGVGGLGGTSGAGAIGGGLGGLGGLKLTLYGGGAGGQGGPSTVSGLGGGGGGGGGGANLGAGGAGGAGQNGAQNGGAGTAAGNGGAGGLGGLGHVGKTGTDPGGDGGNGGNTLGGNGANGSNAMVDANGNTYGGGGGGGGGAGGTRLTGAGQGGAGGLGPNSGWSGTSGSVGGPFYLHWLGSENGAGYGGEGAPGGGGLIVLGASTGQITNSGLIQTVAGGGASAGVGGIYVIDSSGHFTPGTLQGNFFEDNTGVSSPSQFFFAGAGGGGGGGGGGAVPEPSTFALLGAAATGLLAFAWRRRSRAA